MLQDGGAMTATATTADVVKDTTTQGFMKDVIEESKRQPVLVDFWARVVRPLQAAHAGPGKSGQGRQGQGQARQDEHRRASGHPGPDGHPVDPRGDRIFNGQPVDGFMGALPESQVAAFLERITKDAVGGEEKDLLKAADAALAEGNADEALPTCMRSCSPRTAPTCRRSPALRAAYVADRRARTGQTDARPGSGSQAQRGGGRRRARRARARRTGEVGRAARASWKRRCSPIRSIIRRVSTSRSRSTRRASAQDAVKHLIDIVKRDRKWNDDGARKQLVQFFEAWGATDEATVDGRKRLSSILFS